MIDRLSYTKIVDTHAHYDDEKFDGIRDELLASLPDRGVGAVINNAVDLSRSAQAVLALAERYPFCYAAIGVHPEDRLKNGPLDRDRLAELLGRPKVVALGEIGLDYHWEPEAAEEQKALFAAQLEVACDLNKPVIVHDREAHADTLELLRRYRPAGTVHCFSGSLETANELVSLGFYIGIGGVVTFKNAGKIARVAAGIPLDRILLETDAPYLAPEPHRGDINRSDYLIEVAAKIASIRGETVETVLAVTAENARRCYGI